MRTILSIGTLCLVVLARPSEIAHYDLRCDLEPEKSHMHVSVDVTPPTSQVKAGKLSFHLATAMGSPEVSVYVSGHPTPVQASKGADEDRDHEWIIQIPPNADSPTRLHVDCASVATSSFVFNLGPEGCFACSQTVSWYPTFEDVRSEGEMTFTTPSDYVVKATGQQLSGSNGRWVFKADVPSFFAFAAARYVVTHIDSKIPITIYCLKPRDLSKIYADKCSRILEYLPKLFGKYPFPDFSVIETPSPQSRKAGFSGASLQGFMFADSPSMDAPFNLAYYAHEMSHQWWGNLIDHKGDKGSMMLDEGLAQFGSLNAVEAIEGSKMADLYRTTGYPGYSDRQCAVGGLCLMAAGFDHPLSSLPKAYQLGYHEIGNSRGFLTYWTIAGQIGRERFANGLKALTTKHAWSSITWEDFLAEVNKAAGGHAQALLSQWLDRREPPLLWATHERRNGRTLITVHQAAPFYKLSIPVEILFADGRKVWREIALDSASTGFEMAGSVSDVKIDPNFEVFHSTPELKAKAEALVYVTRAKLDDINGDYKKERADCNEGLTHVTKPDRYGVEAELKSMLSKLKSP